MGAWLIFYSWNHQGIDSKCKSALEERLGTTFSWIDRVQRDPCLRDVAIDPGGVEEPCDGGSSHMAFDSRHGLGLRDLTNYVAHSHTPRAHCVRFGRAVKEAGRRRL